MSKEKKWVLVTGSAHRVGKEIAELFVSRGYNLYLHYNSSKSKAEETKGNLLNFGSEIELIQADLADENQINSMMGKISNRGLDVLVNSAAGFKKTPFLKIQPHEFDQVINVNLKAPFLLTQRAAEIMKKNIGKEKGSIINISDLSGLHPWKGYSHHGVTKAGLIHLTKISALELGPEIRVNAVVPGLILKPSGMDDPSRWNQMMNNIPVQRSGHPQDVAEATFYLATSRFLNGVILPVDGGENLVGSVNHL